jgi:hypothetical protein
MVPPEPGGVGDALGVGVIAGPAGVNATAADVALGGGGESDPQPAAARINAAAVVTSMTDAAKRPRPDALSRRMGLNALSR